MGNIFLTPQWFFGYDIGLEIFFAIITMFVSFFAFKIYKISSERQLKLFSWAFLSISLAYIAQSVLNMLIITNLAENVSLMVKLHNVFLLNLFGIYLHSILFLIGLLILAYLVMKVESKSTFILLFMITFGSLYFAANKTFMLYFISAMLLGFTGLHYFMNFWKSRKTTALLVFLAIVLLLVSTVNFILATEDPFYYVVAHMLEFAAYILIFISITLILRRGGNGKKKR